MIKTKNGSYLEHKIKYRMTFLNRLVWGGLSKSLATNLF